MLTNPTLNAKLASPSGQPISAKPVNIDINPRVNIMRCRVAHKNDTGIDVFS